MLDMFEVNVSYFQLSRNFINNRLYTWFLAVCMTTGVFMLLTHTDIRMYTEGLHYLTKSRNQPHNTPFTVP